MLWQWVNTGAQVFILDLDGTLMPSAGIDNRCYWQAVFACFGVSGPLPDLHGFRHVTDSGILDEWCHRELGHAARSEEIEWIRQRFSQLLEEAFNQQPRHFTPTPGVEDWLEAVGARRHVCAGIATGGWGHSARLKLRHSGLDRFELPLASSDDAIARTDIMRISLGRTLQKVSTDRPTITYVGDSPWDFHASRLLDWRFVGIASGHAAAQLRKAGATCIRPDFKKYDLDQGPGRISV